MDYCLGIDPGISGGIALVSSDYSDAAVSSCPGKGDPKEMAHYLRKLHKHYPDIRLAILEQVSAMPKQGVSSMFTFGRGLGNWEGILCTLGIPYVTVTPQKWQARLLESRAKKNKGKDTKILSVECAELLFPSHTFRGPRGGIIDGKSDAIHLARWGHLILKGEAT